MKKREKNRGIGREEAVYVISVAAKLADVHPQTLRIYERKGLLKPSRVKDRRRYSEADIERCRLIQELTQGMGVNLAGVKMILDLRDRIESMEREARLMEKEMARLKERMQRELEELSKRSRNEIVPVTHGGLMLANSAKLFNRPRGKRIEVREE